MCVCGVCVCWGWFDVVKYQINIKILSSGGKVNRGDGMRYTSGEKLQNLG